MTVKIVYLNGCFEYIRNVRSIRYENYEYVLELENGRKVEYDERLKLEISRYEY